MAFPNFKLMYRSIKVRCSMSRVKKFATFSLLRYQIVGYCKRYVRLFRPLDTALSPLISHFALPCHATPSNRLRPPVPRPLRHRRRHGVRPRPSIPAFSRLLSRRSLITICGRWRMDRVDDSGGGCVNNGDGNKRRRTRSPINVWPMTPVNSNLGAEPKLKSR